MINPLISLNKVSVNLSERLILSNIHLSISPREIVTIIGPNGAGKSTLIKLLAGLITSSQGSIEKENSLRIGYMPQKLRLDESLPMKVSRFLSLASSSKSERQDVLELVEITHLRSQSLHALSGGELQRVLLARAILRRPSLLLLDEPMQGVDVTGQIALYRLIATLSESLNCAVAMVSHDLHLVMAQTDTVVCLNQHICCHGKPENVSRHPEYLRLFGKQAEELAVYTHHHDHHHNMHGDVISEKEKHHD